MSSTHSTRKQNLRLLSKTEKGAEEGRKYEEILEVALLTIAYKLSKHVKPKIHEFVICREVKIGKYRKFDDIVLSYADQDNSKKLIFVQVKHKQDYKVIKSGILSTEAARAKDIKGPYGYMCEAFNLQKYFISYLSISDELEQTDTKEMKDGKIKHVVIFTNVGLDCKELGEKGFILKKAPDDIVNLFTLSSDAQHSDDFYQLEDVSEDSRKVLKKSSDFDRIARELAHYAVGKNHRKNEIMGYVGTPLEHCHSWLGNFVIKTSLEKVYMIKVMEKRKIKKRKFREAQFRDEFLKSTAQPLQTLRNALFEAIREIDKSKKGASEEDLKKDLKAAKWKIVPSFGSSLQNTKTDLPCEWISISDEDISGFLQRFVFIANQPKVAELDLLCKHLIQNVVTENTSLRQHKDQIYATEEEFKKLVTSKKPHNEEMWFSSDLTGRVLEKGSQLVENGIDGTKLTQMYEIGVMQHGKFNDVGKKLENVDTFLASNCQILCVNTPVTLLSSIKLLQHLNVINGLISVSLNDVNCAEKRDSVLKAFELENNSLLTIECTHKFNDHIINFFYELVNIVKAHSNKKIILILQQQNCDIIKAYFQDGVIYVVENDYLDIKCFEPKEDLLAKKKVVFQEQKEKLSFSDITGVKCWKFFVDILCQGTNVHQQSGMTLFDILTNDEIEVGSKPEGTSNLEGAFAKIDKKINVETLVNKLTSQEHDMYIFSVITDFREQDKTVELLQCLERRVENAKLKNDLEEFKNRLKTASVTNLKVFDDQFEVKNFQEICHSHPEKRISWICANRENDLTTFSLQETYNPKFYLKRKFKNVIIKKDLKEHLIKDYLSEIFIFHCAGGKQELYNSMKLNAREVEQFENSCMIKIRIQKSDAEADFECFKEKETVHLLEFEKKQFVWCKSHGSEKTLHKYIDYELGETSLIGEDTLITKIKDRKVVIFADDPGMGKTTTLIKLYEKEIASSSIINSHWVIGIKLRDHLKAVRNLYNNGISIVRVVELLSKIDSKLNNNLAKIVLKIALDKSGKFQTKPLLLVLDGFDEFVNEGDRNCILQILKFIKDKTAAKLWITTRCHFKKLLEEELSAIAVQFSPLDDAQKAQYIKIYLQHRLHLILNEEKYTELFDKDDKKRNNEKIHMYIAVFINKMKSIFRGDIATFIGAPLQMYLMLEDSERHFKKYMESDDIEIPNLDYLGNNAFEIFEHFIEKKYGVYYHKRGIKGLEQEREKYNLDREHKSFAISKYFEGNTDDNFEKWKNLFLLVGVIKSQGSDLQFIHKTVEEFFVSKVFLDWIRKAPNTNDQENLLKVILMKPDYQLVRTFMNLQLQKLSEQAGKGLNERERSLENYGNVAAELLNQENSPLINENRETPLHIAVQEGNKHIVYFLLNILKGHPDVLKKFIFTPNADNSTALHLACMREDIGTVKALLDTAAGISKETLQEYLKFGTRCNLFEIAKMHNKSVEICKELLSRANDKLDLVIFSSRRSTLCTACLHGRENFVELLLQEFEHDTHSLKKLLLYRDACGNALGCAKSTTTVEKLISAAKSVKDDNETLKKLLLPVRGKKPFQCIIWDTEIDVVEKESNVSKKIDENTRKQLLLNKRPGISALHVADRVDIIKLLVKTTADLGLDMLEKLIYTVDKEGKNSMLLMVDRFHVNGTGIIIADILKIFEEEKYQNIRKKVMEILDNEPLKSMLYFYKEKFMSAIELGDILEVKGILSKVKSFSVNFNESLRILLLDNNFLLNDTLYIACYGQSAVHGAVECGHFDDEKALLETESKNERIDDCFRDMDQAFSNERRAQSAVHSAVECGHFDDEKALLETEWETEDENDAFRDIEQAFSNERRAQSALHFAVECGCFKITKLLLEYAVGMDDDNHTLKQLLWNDRSGVSALHVAAHSRGGSDIVKLLLETTASILGIEMLEKLIFAVNMKGQNAIHVVAKRDLRDSTKLLLKTVRDEGIHDDTQKQLLLNNRQGGGDIVKLLIEKTATALGIEIMEKLIFAVNMEGKNAIQLMVDRGQVLIFADSFLMLKEKYPDTWEKIKDLVPPESKLYLQKRKLIMGRDLVRAKTVKFYSQSPYTLRGLKHYSMPANGNIDKLSKNYCPVL